MLGKNSYGRFEKSRANKHRVTVFSLVFGTLLGLSNSFWGSGAIALAPQNSHATDRRFTVQNIPQGTILEQKDLPPGFEVAPPLFQQLLSRAIERRKTDLDKANISVRETAIFLDFEEADIVACVVMSLPDRIARKNFDALLQRDDGGAAFQSGFQQVVQGLGAAKMAEPRAIEPLEGLGETARGYRLGAAIENFPMRIFADSLAFRRRETGVLLIVGSIDRLPERVRVQDLARTLDRRLQNAKTVSKSENQAFFAGSEIGDRQK